MAEKEFTLYQKHNPTGGADLVVIYENHAVAYLHANLDGTIGFVDKLLDPVSLKVVSIGFFIRNWRMIAIETMKKEAVAKK